MDLLESQVTEINYLAESPIPLMNDQRQISESGSTPKASGKAPSKRKAGEDADPNGGAPHTRAKRNRYISIACNECKRRKIKCNGNTPCQRCGNLNLECQYAPNCCTNGFKESEEFRQMNAHIASLQEQVDNLYASLNALRNGGDSMKFPTQSERSTSVSQPPGLPPLSPINTHRAPAKHPSFRGPTSSAYSLDVANTTLHNMGYQGLEVENVTQDPTPAATPPNGLQRVIVNRDASGKPMRDPLWSFTKEEAIRLCRVYEEEMGLMYPVVDVEEVIRHSQIMYDFHCAIIKNGLDNKSDIGTGINDEGSLVLKMVLACSLVAESGGQSELGHRLSESVRGAADRALHSENIELKSLPLLTLMAIYHFHCDEEALAWRLIGQVARMCVELGLHRRDSFFKSVTDLEERAKVLRLFWSIYVLDRRWSFGTGMPFALQDADIDPNLPEPEMKLPYLNVMIAYSRIGSKVWRSISSYSPTMSPSLNIEEIGYLDYQILQWQKSIPPKLQLPTTNSPQTSSRAIHRLQILLYLRTNQMRILIYRPVLHSASSIQENISCATTVVELAKDTIRALTHLNQTTDIYRAQQVCFNYFLISALAVIFLASCHAPVHFSSYCRGEFYMALDLVKGFSHKSFVSKRLWKTIKGLKEVGPKLGLSQDLDGSMEDPHSSAALAMAGLAGHEISSMNSFADGIGLPAGANTGSPMNGFQMSNEMTHLFEAALGSVGINGGTNGDYTPISDTEALAGIGSNAFGGDEELYRHLKDLF